MEWLITAKIRGAFGLEGFLKVESCSGEYKHFLKLKDVMVSCPNKQKETEQYIVEKCVLRANDALFKLKGIDSPEAAKKLHGADILVPRGMACPLESGEFYINDLCNANLVCDGDTVGVITDVIEGGGGFLLELSEAATGRKKYVPFRFEFIGSVDIEKKQVELMHRWILE